MKLCILLCFVAIAAVSFQILSEIILFDLRISADRMENSRNLYICQKMECVNHLYNQKIRLKKHTYTVMRTLMCDRRMRHECTAGVQSPSVSGPSEERRYLGTVFWCLRTAAAPTERERVQTPKGSVSQRPHTNQLAQYVRITLDKSIVDCYNTEHEKTKASY